MAAGVGHRDCGVDMSEERRYAWEKRFLLVGIVVLTTANLPRFAQAQSASAADSSLRAVITRISAGRPRAVRLVSQRTKRLRGDSLQLNGDSVVLHSERGTRTVALQEVDSLWVSRGSASRIVGIVAAVPCAIYGGLVGAFLATDPDSNGRPGRAPMGAMIGGAAGALVCGLPGFGIGSLIKRWRLEYTRPPRDVGQQAIIARSRSNLVAVSIYSVPL